MRRSAWVFLVIALVAGLFSFGLVNNIHWVPAQIVFGISVVLFGISAVLGYTPSQQIHFGKTAAPAPATASRPSLLSNPASPAAVALLYITFGSLGAIWSLDWYWYLRNHVPQYAIMWYICYGALLTSLAFFIIGLAVGRVSRAARAAE
jgi:uncharacterized membrane protein YtjA (UPF0391 family)